uniref:Putative LOC101234914 [Hydra vulgaris] n=1 Tax=Lepeophtheirus salmonis TaxID=72036 RepID=A0A0K2TJV9_LEPSM
MLISTCVNNIEFIVCIVVFNNRLLSHIKMCNFVPTNYDVWTSLIFCYQWKKYASQAHRMLVEAYGGQDRKSSKTPNCKHCSMKMMTKHKNISQND